MVAQRNQPVPANQACERWEMRRVRDGPRDSSPEPFFEYVYLGHDESWKFIQALFFAYFLPTCLRNHRLKDMKCIFHLPCKMYSTV